MRRHGWQRPFHHLQILGVVVFSLQLVAFYCFLGLLLGNKVAQITVTACFSVAVALSAALLFIRCTAIDPSDRTRFRLQRKRKKNRLRSSNGLNYGFLMFQVMAGFFKRLERKILRTCIRRKYVLLDPISEPLFQFPLVLKKDQDDSIAPDSTKWNDISFCSLCDFEVQKHSKHCRTCDRCVEGFDHHCRWMNNCVGKKNYTTFFLLMVCLLTMLIIEGGTAIAVFVRCFADRRRIEKELITSNFIKIPRGAVAALSVFLVLITAYCSAAMGQLFLFHVLLIRKGMRTYDYILAMKEKNRLMEMEMEALEEDSDYTVSSDDDDDDEEDFDSISPEKKPKFMSCFIRSRSQMGETMNKNMHKLSIMIHGEAERSGTENNKKQAFQASINPWKLINMSQEKALLAATQAKEKVMKEKNHEPMRPLPLETRSGPTMMTSSNSSSSLALNQKERMMFMGSSSPVARLSSPRLRRFSSSPTQSPGSMARCKSNFDLQLTRVSKELEMHISRQVLSSVIKEEGQNEV